jgi:hypothetical protein
MNLRTWLLNPNILGSVNDSLHSVFAISVAARPTYQCSLSLDESLVSSDDEFLTLLTCDRMCKSSKSTSLNSEFRLNENDHHVFWYYLGQQIV